MDGHADNDKLFRLVQVRVSDSRYEWLRAKAFYERKSMNALINEAIALYADQQASQETWRAAYEASKNDSSDRG